MKERIKWIDNARGICMFCVLLAHSNVDHPILHTLYTPWFLTLFFFISGYLFSIRSLKEDVLKIVKHLLAPYFLLSFLLFFIGMDNWAALFKWDMEYLYNKVYYILIGKNLWFIPCLIVVQFYVSILSHTIMKSLRMKLLVCIIMFCSVYLIRNKDGYVAPYCADIALFATAYFLMGNIVRKANFSQLLSIPKLLYILNKPICSILLLIIYMVISYILQRNMDMEFHFATNYYDNPFLFILLSILGIMVVCLFSNSFSAKFLRLFGENTLIAFAFNGKAYAISMIFLSSFNLCSQELFAIILSSVEVFVLLIIAYIINKFMPWLIGKY